MYPNDVYNIAHAITPPTSNRHIGNQSIKKSILPILLIFLFFDIYQPNKNIALYYTHYFFLLQHQECHQRF